MLSRKVRAAIESSQLIRPGDRMLVGVSGGPDSVALVHVLAGLQPHFGYTLHVVHLNHRLRGEESERDAQFVVDLAAGLNLPVTVEARDVRSLARQRRLGVEEAARVARYGFFATLSERLASRCVAVGHTADDQVETVVLHWLRGAGLAGLRGMAQTSTLSVGAWETGSNARAVTVLRPLLAVRRSEVEEYLAAHRLAYRVDVSNVDVSFLRNRVRLEVLPFLEGQNPRIREAVLRTARLASQDYDYVISQVRAEWPRLATVAQESVTIDLGRWSALPASLQYYVLREAVVMLLGEALDITSAHLDAAVDAMASRPVGTTVVWPRQVRIIKGYTSFEVRLGMPRPGPRLAGEWKLRIPGETVLGDTGWKVVARVSPRRCDGQRSGGWHADLDFDRVGPEVVVRGRKPGDAFVPLGMVGSKKLQDFLVDRKVPRSERDAVPIVVTPSQIVWVAGQQIDERAKVTDRTRAVLCLTFVRYNGTATS